jgi:hypothetical protein
MLFSTLSEVARSSQPTSCSAASSFDPNLGLGSLESTYSRATSGRLPSGALLEVKRSRQLSRPTSDAIRRAQQSCPNESESEGELDSAKEVHA